MSGKSPQVVLPQRIEAVVFDVGETLVDETGHGPSLPKRPA
ncbi:MAG: hypothetical protein M0Z34_09570 [Nitrospiraceae bacterium]|nr:hypothetical protein [Nitrospiraceae bacterium]